MFGEFTHMPFALSYAFFPSNAAGRVHVRKAIAVASIYVSSVFLGAQADAAVLTIADQQASENPVSALSATLGPASLINFQQQTSLCSTGWVWLPESLCAATQPSAPQSVDFEERRVCFKGECITLYAVYPKPGISFYVAYFAKQWFAWGDYKWRPNEEEPPPEVPAPASLALMLSGVFGYMFAVRRKRGR